MNLSAKERLLIWLKDPFFVVSIALSIAGIWIIWPFISALSLGSIIMSFLVFLIISYLALSIPVYIITAVLKTVKVSLRIKLKIKVAIVCAVLLVALQTTYYARARLAKASGATVLEYPNVSFQFFNFGEYKVMTVCEDNVLLECIGIWEKYLGLHEDFGSFNFSSWNYEDIARELFFEALNAGYIPDFNAKYAPGPWYPIISFWNWLGYRGPWWVWDALSVTRNLSYVWLPVNPDVLALHVAVIVGYRNSSGGFEIVVDWCGVESFWDDVTVNLEAVFCSIESVCIVSPKNVTGLLKLAEVAEKKFSYDDLVRLIVCLIEIRVPIIIAVDSNLFIDRAFGPIGFAGMLSYMLLVPLIPFFV